MNYRSNFCDSSLKSIPGSISNNVLVRRTSCTLLGTGCGVLLLGFIGSGHFVVIFFFSVVIGGGFCLNDISVSKLLPQLSIVWVPSSILLGLLKYASLRGYGDPKLPVFSSPSDDFLFLGEERLGNFLSLIAVMPFGAKGIRAGTWGDYGSFDFIRRCKVFGYIP